MHIKILNKKMEYQNTAEDNALIEKMEREEKEMLFKYYGLRKSDTNCPKNAYLLKPERLHLISYELLPDKRVKLNIGYMRTWSGYVSSTVRMNYNQYILGTLYCEEVEFIKEVGFNKKGTITFPFFSNSKILNLPIQSTHNVSIRCKSIRVKHIDIYVKDSEGKFILDEIYRENLRSQLENNNNSKDRV
jgi:hypothetical protein